jgi:hypothetical protein
VAGWSSGIKLLQSQLQLKKAVQTQVTWHTCVLYVEGPWFKFMPS